MQQSPQKETITLKYETTDNSVDAAAVGGTILAVADVAQRVRQRFKTDDEFLVKARPLKKGSLEVPIDVILFAHALTQDPLFQAIREVIRQFFELKQLFFDQQLTLLDGNIIVVDSRPVRVNPVTIELLDTDSRESTLLRDAFARVAADRSVTALEILGPGRDKLARIPRERFDRFTVANVQQARPAARAIRSREVVTVVQLAFEPDLQWRFAWQGFRIPSRVADEDFLKRVRSGEEAFAAGDQLEVDLERTEEYDVDARTHLNKSFSIARVWKHYRREDTARMF